MKKVLYLLLVVIIAYSCTPSFTQDEKEIINSELRIYKTSHPTDSLVLRTKCIDIPRSELNKADYKLLVEKMLKIVQLPENDGVGIAAPQIGINRNLALIQRFDKKSLSSQTLFR